MKKFLTGVFLLASCLMMSATDDHKFDDSSLKEQVRFYMKKDLYKGLGYSFAFIASCISLMELYRRFENARSGDHRRDVESMSTFASRMCKKHGLVDENAPDVVDEELLKKNLPLAYARTHADYIEMVLYLSMSSYIVYLNLKKRVPQNAWHYLKKAFS